ncbi:MAG: hypothetical protein KME60_07110 [Cyanomargarita calcarea GSE-NOS-MK-12-04C]|jgi:hypothetical protein|uniref:Uncharacterized protein n=1 Tax=Cyanomargarita calcarea GSE-NOS-MK-12-04C TaxID=2839659 RepID=A0A951QK83_9CYAN|nr:hypothetical protein [Cyanomargarita calcarea GSE-NOS-MK-12-04C]
MFAFNKVKTISLVLNASSGSQIVEVFPLPDVSTFGIETSKLLSLNTFVKNLKAYAKIESLPAIQLPNFQLEDSETDKLYKTLDIEWGSPRKQLNLYISNNNQWHMIGAVSLLNPAGYPYRMYNLLDLYTDNLAIELGQDGKLGIQIQDVGFGLLQSNDTVTVHGSYLHEIAAIDAATTASAALPIQIISQQEFLISFDDELITIASYEENRKYLLIENIGSGEVTLHFGGSSAAQISINSGGNYEFSVGALYWTQTVHATGNTIVRVTKGF